MKLTEPQMRLLTACAQNPAGSVPVRRMDTAYCLSRFGFVRIVGIADAAITEAGLKYHREASPPPTPDPGPKESHSL